MIGRNGYVPAPRSSACMARAPHPRRALVRAIVAGCATPLRTARMPLREASALGVTAALRAFVPRSRVLPVPGRPVAVRSLCLNRTVCCFVSVCVSYSLFAHAVGCGVAARYTILRFGVVGCLRTVACM